MGLADSLCAGDGDDALGLGLQQGMVMPTDPKISATDTKKTHAVGLQRKIKET